MENIIKTGVDRLIDLLKKKDKITISEASKVLKIPVSTIQKWVDFLVEENIVNVEYKFTVPYIFLNKAQKELEKKTKKKINLQTLKQDYFNNATLKKIPFININNAWNKKLKKELKNQKKYFFRYAKLKKIKEPEKLWAEFERLILKENDETKIKENN